jgi:hypothetical protein
MPKIRLDRLTLRLRGVSVAEARRAVTELGPALARRMQGSAAATSTIVGKAPLADRIAAPLTDRLRGDKR